TKGFAAIAQTIGGLHLPTVVIQEGGYLCPALPMNLVTFLQEL
ncbi:MAG: histone deacetylase family protein, partial [Steroidobacteraceae bacterium]